MGSASPPPVDYAAAAAAVEEPSPEPPAAASAPPPVHESRQVMRFRDSYGRVWPYCGTFRFEVEPNCDPSEGFDADSDSEDEDDYFAKPTGNFAEINRQLVKYVNQIRQSFGFDLDCDAPNWFRGGFYPINMESAKLHNQWLYDRIIEIAHFAVAEINSDLIYDGKNSIELVKLEKVVRNIPAMDLLTLRVKTKEVDDDETKIEDDGMNVQTIQALVYEGPGAEPPRLEQWRFKPVEPDFWYEAPPLPPRTPEIGDQ